MRGSALPCRRNTTRQNRLRSRIPHDSYCRRTSAVPFVLTPPRGKRGGEQSGALPQASHPVRLSYPAAATTATATATMKRSMMRQKAVEWLDEAAKIAANQPSIGRDDVANGTEEGKGNGTSFSITGHNAALWARATVPERRAVIEAFASNTVVTNVAMVNAHINDELGATWGSVMSRNATITVLLRL